MRRGVRLYDPAKVRKYKSDLALRVRMRYPSKPLTGPLKVTLRFYRHLQASLTKKRTCPAAVRSPQADCEA
ncbi:RusA family crossover junction endodeoxyribonuclease [Limosilactobacillus oris]|uniref:RusA family crossover junction endodeoxyribonuclease n=1 Tax=Limosilactobacillus oris TaxID=1632 RepID=UPI002FD8DF67